LLFSNSTLQDIERDEDQKRSRFRLISAPAVGLLATATAFATSSPEARSLADQVTAICSAPFSSSSR
jgi:hypothetical protein